MGELNFMLDQITYLIEYLNKRYSHLERKTSTFSDYQLKILHPTCGALDIYLMVNQNMFGQIYYFDLVVPYRGSVEISKLEVYLDWWDSTHSFPSADRMTYIRPTQSDDFLSILIDRNKTLCEPAEIDSTKDIVYVKMLGDNWEFKLGGGSGRFKGIMFNDVALPLSSNSDLMLDIIFDSRKIRQWKLNQFV
jgi:hypothetical protein